MKPMLVTTDYPLAVIMTPSPDWTCSNLRRSLEDKLDAIGATPIMRIIARRVFKKSGYAYALATIKGWEVSIA